MKTRYFSIWIGVVVLLAVCSGCRKPTRSPEQSQALDLKSAVAKVEQADALYAQREDVSRVREGLTLLRQAQIEDTGSYEVAWRLAMFNYYLGSHANDEDESYKAFNEGIDAGKKAVALQPDKAEGHFWLGANYGGNARVSTLAGLTDFDDIRHEMETVLKIDEGFHGGSAYMGLGQLYLEAPRILGGDVVKSVELLEKGKRIGPTNALMRLRLAEAYHAAKRDGDARRELTELFSLTPSEGFEPEYKEAVSEGHKLMQKL